MGFPVFPLYWPYGETATGYREEGYFPEAFVNMLALLGWNPGTEQELFSMNDLITAFSIERVGKSGSRFDPEKARWFNHQYLQQKSNEELAGLFMPVVREKGFNPSHESLLKIVSMVRERATFVKDMWKETDFFFMAPETYDEKEVKKRWDENSAGMISSLRELVASMKVFTAEAMEKEIREWVSANEFNTGNVFNLFRLLIVGTCRGPRLFDIAEWLGKEETLRRLDTGLRKLIA
jgi:glutamyl-tRNA synthetase